MSSECQSNYGNAMEPLVVEQIRRKIQELPGDEAATINQTEAIAYALNRLPPLYSTTQEGWDWQQDKARETLADLIDKATSWGIRAASCNHSRFFSTPLDNEVKVFDKTDDQYS